MHVSDTVAEPRGLFVWFGCIPDRSACSGRGVSLDSAAEPFTHASHLSVCFICLVACIMFASRANMIIMLFLTSVIVCLSCQRHTHIRSQLPSGILFTTCYQMVRDRLIAYLHACRCDRSHLCYVILLPSVAMWLKPRRSRDTSAISSSCSVAKQRPAGRAGPRALMDLC